MFFLVRHADAGDKHRWTEDDHQRPLSPRGRSQADAVGALIAGSGASRLLSSPFLRCVQTLVPVTRRTGLPVETRAELAVGASAASVLALLERPEIDGAVLCTHGETLNALSLEWERSGRVDVVAPGRAPRIAGTPKGAIWVVEDYHGSAARALFIPPGLMGRSAAPEGTTAREVLSLPLAT